MVHYAIAKAWGMTICMMSRSLLTCRRSLHMSVPLASRYSEYTARIGTVIWRAGRPASWGYLMPRFAKEHAAAVAGDYRQSAQQWLGSSWQGDALQVRQCHVQIAESLFLFFVTHGRSHNKGGPKPHRLLVDLPDPLVSSQACYEKA